MSQEVDEILKQTISRITNAAGEFPAWIAGFVGHHSARDHDRFCLAGNCPAIARARSIR